MCQKRFKEESKVDKVEKTVSKILEMLKKSPFNIKNIKEEIAVDVKFISENLFQRAEYP